MIANSFFALAGLTGFLLLFYGPWQSVCTDVARQLMFEQRDKIFDMARGGVINFESSEYRRVRISIEQDIRFAHQLTLARLIFVAWSLHLFGRRGEDLWKSDLFPAIERIADDNVRNEMLRRVRLVHVYMICMIICKSLICWLILPLLVLIVMVAMATARLYALCKKAVRYTGELIQIEAECV
jgi:hypothetical protein